MRPAAKTKKKRDAEGAHPLLAPPMRQVLDRLYAEHGRPEIEPDEDVLTTLIATLLSQSTSDVNSTRAFGAMVDHFEGDWRRVEEAPTPELAQAIAVGGLANQKAPRIQKILGRVREDFGAYTLEALRGWTSDRAKAYLLGMHGVGPKTASFVLMRAAQMPLFAMDTHILRLCRRLGWISASRSASSAHEFMLAHIPPGEHDPAHVVMIRHGRRICHARAPECGRCPLRPVCAHAKEMEQAPKASPSRG